MCEKIERKIMVAKSLEGWQLASQIRQRTHQQIQELPSPPKLVSLMVGENKDSLAYAKVQQRSCEEVGIEFSLQNFPSSVSQQQLLDYIKSLNHNKEVTGILIFMPLPENIDGDLLLRAISPNKDVEGLTPPNMGRLFYNDYTLAPCAAKAIVLLLEAYQISLAGKEVVVVSRSRIIGQPLMIMLLQFADQSPTPTCCHIGTQDLASHTRKADVLIVAAGQAGLIHGDMIKKDAVIIDVGINPIKRALRGKMETHIVGDVDAESAKKVASWITPVPGGVGLVTTALLLENVATLATEQHKGH